MQKKERKGTIKMNKRIKFIVVVSIALLSADLIANYISQGYEIKAATHTTLYLTKIPPIPQNK
jgi:hypothetical protein